MLLTTEKEFIATSVCWGEELSRVEWSEFGCFRVGNQRLNASPWPAEPLFIPAGAQLFSSSCQLVHSGTSLSPNFVRNLFLLWPLGSALLTIKQNFQMENNVETEEKKKRPKNKMSLTILVFEIFFGTFLRCAADQEVIFPFFPPSRLIPKVNNPAAAAEIFRQPRRITGLPKCVYVHTFWP